jgi:hypothetical protein
MNLLLILFVAETLENSDVSQDSQPSPLHYHPLPSKGDCTCHRARNSILFCCCPRPRPRRIPVLTLVLHQTGAGGGENGASARPPGARWTAQTM